MIDRPTQPQVRIPRKSAASGSGAEVGHPLGPVVRFIPSAHVVRARLIALLVAVACITPLVVAARLDPAAAGVGTHRQLGAPACSMLVVTGYPCPTCGMTTAFAYTVRGRIDQALAVQPFGALLAVSAFLGGLCAIYACIRGGSWIINWYRIPPLRLALIVVGLFVGAWAYKIILVRWTAH